MVRPDLLQPLIWPMVILMAGTVGLALVGAPKGITTMSGIVLVLNVIIYIVVYIGCLKARPDALRMETITVGPAAPNKSENGTS